MPSLIKKISLWRTQNADKKQSKCTACSEGIADAKRCLKSKAHAICGHSKPSTADPTAQIASAIHDSWRKHSGVKTCVKPVKKDVEWIEKNGTECDIQNTRFEDLPADWKCKSYELAKTVVEIVSETHNIVTASAILYGRWSHCGCSQPSSSVPFDELSKERQEDFISIVRLATSVLI